MYVRTAWSYIIIVDAGQTLALVDHYNWWCPYVTPQKCTKEAYLREKLLKHSCRMTMKMFNWLKSNIIIRLQSWSLTIITLNSQ